MSETDEHARPVGGSSKAPWIVLAIACAAIAVTAIYSWPTIRSAFAKEASIVVYKTPTCGCCTDWTQHLQDAGFDVSVVNVGSTRPIQSQVGVPYQLGSCHTAVIGDYWVEGHVPADLVKRLMTDRPDNIRGISVPGMPIGSPGMEGPNPVEYDVVALDSDGKAFVYATRQGVSHPDAH